MHHDPPNFCGFTAKLAAVTTDACPSAIAAKTAVARNCKKDLLL